MASLSSRPHSGEGYRYRPPGARLMGCTGIMISGLERPEHIQTVCQKIRESFQELNNFWWLGKMHTSTTFRELKWHPTKDSTSSRTFSRDSTRKSGSQSRSRNVNALPERSRTTESVNCCSRMRIWSLLANTILQKKYSQDAGDARTAESRSCSSSARNCARKDFPTDHAAAQRWMENAKSPIRNAFTRKDSDLLCGKMSWIRSRTDT